MKVSPVRLCASFLCVLLYSSQLLAAPCGNTGSVSGSVFNDYNGNTIRGITNIETGVSNVTVSLYSNDGSVTSCETQPDGDFFLDAPSGGFPVRLEVTLPDTLDFLNSTISGPTRVQFLSAATADIEIGLLNPREYCTDDPLVATSCYVNGNPELDEGDPDTASVADVLVAFRYGATGNTAATENIYLAFGGEIGATWGLAYQRQSGNLFAAAMMKRHVGFAQLGPGGIYQIDVNDPANPVVTEFVDLAAAPYNIDFGIDSHNLPSSDPTVATYDTGAWDAVGKVGYGGMAISEDETTLWTINLNDKRLYEIPVGVPAAAPLAADIQSYDIPNPSCEDSSALPVVAAPNDHRPWAIEYYQGQVWVGVVCSGEASGSVDDLKAAVYSLNPDDASPSFNLVFEFDLDYPRGNVSVSGGNATPAEWLAWIDDFTDIPNPNQTFGQAIYPQPILSDIQFDTDGSILLGFADRLGHQMGNNNFGIEPSTELHEAAVAGDVLRLCFDGTNYSLEDNASCDGGLTETNGADGANGGQGPGGGEYYWQDMYTVSANQDAGAHNEVVIGGLAHLPGSGEMILTVYDPTNQFRSGGTRWFSHADGGSNRGYMIFGTDAGGGATTFGKSAGLGDLELLCPQAPLEIGNRLWCDSDDDGIQDPNESGIPGVAVTLSCGLDVPVTINSDGNGNYLFTDTIYDGVNNSLIPRNASCTVQIDTSIAANNTAIINACGSDRLSPVNNGGGDPGADLRDSDGVDIGGGVVSVDVDTGFAGANDHTVDFGFGPGLDLGDNPDSYDTVIASNGAQHILSTGLHLGACVDSETDGAPGAAANGDDTAVGQTTEGTCATANDDEDGVTDVQNVYVGNTAASVDVTSTGACILDAWIDFNQDGDFDAAEQIFNGVTLVDGLNDDLFFTVPSDAVAGDTYSRYRCSSAGGLGPNGSAADGEVEDYLITVAPSFSLGDYVWYDQNQDGIQDASENGINGIDVVLYDNATCTAPSIDSTTTANGGTPATDGFYEFAPLPAGDYCVEFSSIPAVYEVSPANQGGDDDVDSDGVVAGAGAQIVVTGLNSDDPSNDLGLFASGSIAGLVWCESPTNPNTMFDGGDGDTLIDGVTITLTEDANCNDVADAGELNQTQTTGPAPAGEYLFTDLVIGPLGGTAVCYVVEVDSADPALGNCDNPIVPESAGPDLTADVPDVTGIDFGFDEQLSLGDFVWYDINQDGIQDLGEPGLNGIDVALYDNATCTGVPVDTAVTTNGGVPATDGFYTFAPLSSGDYCVEFTNFPVGLEVSPANQGGDDTIDSDGISVGAGAQISVPGLNSNDPTNDLGLFTTGSIAGLVWCESATNANTVFDAGDGDTLIDGVGITLTADTNCNDVADAGETSVNQTTGPAPAGEYLFDNLAVGAPGGAAVCYVVEVDPADPALGNCDNPIVPESAGPDLTADVPDVTGIDFGFDELVSLGDFVWYDINQDGIQDTGEPGLNGIDVALYDNATCTGAPVDTTVTANGGVPATDGFYFFNSLSVGDYCIEFSSLPAGFEVSPANQGGDDTIDSDGIVAGAGAQISVPGLAATDPSNDLGLFAEGSIAGLTWCESPTNPNTSYDAADGDSLLDNITLTLTEDANCNDVADAGETSSTQSTGPAPAGAYLFDNLNVGPPGGPAVCYVVTVDVNDPDLAGCDNPIVPESAGPDLDASNPDVTDINFGFDDQTSLGDLVWYDGNHNGIFEVGEPPVVGVTVTLYDNPSCTAPSVDSTITDGSGLYTFSPLVSGDYCVEFTGLPSGYTFTLPNQGVDDEVDSDVDPATGQIPSISLTDPDPTNDAGVYAAIGTVSGEVFCDIDPSNGTNDPSEGVPNITVDLLDDVDCDGEGEGVFASQTTGADGTYEFLNVPVGLAPIPPNPNVCYVVSFDDSDPDLGECNQPILPPDVPVEVSTVDPEVTDVTYGVIPTGEPQMVPVNNKWALLLLMIMFVGMLGFTRMRKHVE